MEKLRVGVVGIGFIGTAHVEALRRLGYVDVVAVADQTEVPAGQRVFMWPTAMMITAR